MFGLLRTARRWRYRRQPFPPEWLPLLEKLPFVAELSAAELARFKENLKVFAREKTFIGAGGMEISDEVIIVISGVAARLVQHLGLSYYNHLTEIVVYPDSYRHPEDDAVIHGEAHTWGTVVLSWKAVLHGLNNTEDAENTAVHEFAHVLDIGSSRFDGTPILRENACYAPWAQVMTHHFERLRSGKKLQRKLLDDYGATNEAEFFAVASETFFEKPRQMREHAPELYDLLSRFYGWNPADR